MYLVGKKITISDRNSPYSGRYGVVVAQEDGIVIVEFDLYPFVTHTQIVKPYEACQPFREEQVGLADIK